ncbi:RNHCP domain-containing protein [Eubacteriaceae bacterium ES3]|nr:RNHCP domain-containing protein [Eubacteriaceae bacterium ES3]
MKYRRKAYYQNHPCQENFICKNCGKTIIPDGAGSQHRNHCPYCLSSLHVDECPGDRAANCSGLMEAISIWVRKNGEWAIIHRCRRCGHLSFNRIAADDNPIKLLSIALNPLANPPFPLESVDLGIEEKQSEMSGGLNHE